MAQYDNNSRYTDTDNDSFEFWNGLRGPAGPQGEPGLNGANVALRGPVATTGALPSSAPDGELWLVGSSSPYNGYFWNGSSWVNTGPIVSGPGVPVGGTTGQYLQKASATNYDTRWRSPSSAAPLMDGDASAGTSTDLARADHVHPHDSTIIRPNLLDNPYFIRTTASFTYGIFPVNQRGNTTYTAGAGENVYTFDRWYMQRATIKSYSTGIRLIWDGENSTYGFLGQFIRSPEALVGKTVTASVLVNNVLLTMTWDSVVADSSGPNVKENIGGYDFGMVLSFTTNNTKPRLVLQSWSPEETHTIKAVKLEIGSSQTLAHLEGNTWVLNEVPCYALEYQKCLASFYREKPGVNSGIYAYGFAASATQFRFTLPLPAPLDYSGTVSVSYSGGIEVATVTGTRVADISNLAIHSKITGEIVLTATTTGLTSGQSYVLRNTSSGQNAYIDITVT